MVETATARFELFGQIAIRKSYVTKQQVEASLELQRDLRQRGQPHKLIGMILLDAGYIDTTQLLDILKTIELSRASGTHGPA